MKRIIIILIIAFISIGASAQILRNYKYDGVTATKSKDEIDFQIRWTVTYEASLALMIKENDRLLVQKRIRNSCNSRLSLLFKRNTAQDLIDATLDGIQAAVDNPNFIESLASEFIASLMDLFNEREVPEFTIISLKINKVSYSTPDS